MCNEYNGWSNKQSWLVGLWLDNDYDTYKAIVARVETLERLAANSRQVLERIWTEEQCVRYKLADWIEETVKNNNPLAGDATMYSDLLSHALALVDWGEVARHYIEE